MNPNGRRLGVINDSINKESSVLGSFSSNTKNDLDNKEENIKEENKIENNDSIKEKEDVKTEPGKEIDEEGNVKDTGTKKTLKAVGRGVAAYLTQGKSLDVDQQIVNNRGANKLIGVVADELDKTPGVKEITKELDESGIPDAANDIMDMAGDIKNGDIGGALEKGNDVKKSVDKFKKKNEKKIMMYAIICGIGAFVILLASVAVLSPIFGGFIDLTNRQSAALNGSDEDGTPGSDDGDLNIDADLVLKKYFPEGVPKEESDMRKYLTTISVPITTKEGTKTTKKLTIHKDVANDLISVLQAAQDGGFIVYDVQGYNWRRINNSNKLSQHSFGLAVDINVVENYCVYPNGQNCGGGSLWDPANNKFSIPRDGILVKAFTSIGWGWGGNWKSKYDYMHFSATNK